MKQSEWAGLAAVLHQGLVLAGLQQQPCQGSRMSHRHLQLGAKHLWQMETVSTTGLLTCTCEVQLSV